MWLAAGVRSFHRDKRSLVLYSYQSPPTLGRLTARTARTGQTKTAAPTQATNSDLETLLIE